MSEATEPMLFRRMIVTDLVHRFAVPTNEMNSRWRIVDVTEREHYTYVIFAVDYVRPKAAPGGIFRTTTVQFRIGDQGVIEAMS